MLSKLSSTWIGISGDKKQDGSKVGNGGPMNNVKAFHDGEMFSFFLSFFLFLFPRMDTKASGYLDTDWID